MGVLIFPRLTYISTNEIGTPSKLGGTMKVLFIASVLFMMIFYFGCDTQVSETQSQCIAKCNEMIKNSIPKDLLETLIGQKLLKDGEFRCKVECQHLGK